MADAAAAVQRRHGVRARLGLTDQLVQALDHDPEGSEKDTLEKH
jgi:hypothetical protein